MSKVHAQWQSDPPGLHQLDTAYGVFRHACSWPSKVPACGLLAAQALAEAEAPTLAKHASETLHCMEQIQRGRAAPSQCMNFCPLLLCRKLHCKFCNLSISLISGQSCCSIIKATMLYFLRAWPGFTADGPLCGLLDSKLCALQQLYRSETENEKSPFRFWLSPLWLSLGMSQSFSSLSFYFVFVLESFKSPYRAWRVNIESVFATLHAFVRTLWLIHRIQ